MPQPEPRSCPRWIPATVLLLLAGVLAGFFVWKAQKSQATVSVRPGRNIIVLGVADGRLDAKLLGTLNWEDVVPTAEGIAANKNLCREVVAVAKRANHPPGAYLSGLLLMASGDLEAALASFTSVPVASIPATHLYAPYRLQSVLRSTQPNPFLPPLARAVAENQVPPLIQARILAAQGKTPAALKAYLQTDPAQWADIDARTLGAMRMQSGSARETAVLLQGALRGGRVPEPIRPQLIAWVKAPSEPVSMEDLKRRMLERIRRDPKLKEAAIAGAAQQLEVKQKFVGKHYRELLDAHRGAAAMEQPDETVLMLTLSAARLKDEMELDRWSKELRRRHPSTDTDTWLNQIRSPAP